MLHCFIDLQCKSIGGLRLGGGHVGHVQMHSMGASAILIILFICLSGQSNLLSERVLFYKLLLTKESGLVSSMVCAIGGIPAYALDVETRRPCIAASSH